MNMQHIQDIQQVINHYFEGIFYGDIEKLEPVFHPRALLIGDIKGQPYFKTVPEYIEGVKNRKSPHQSGEDFAMKILSLEVLENIAYVKTHTPMLGFNYYDYLSLNREQGKWKVVNKLFAHSGR